MKQCFGYYGKRCIWLLSQENQIKELEFIQKIMNNKDRLLTTSKFETTLEIK
jgi:hypothetical protein